MTKKVRIENADSAQYGLVVEVFMKGFPDGEPDKRIEARALRSPADLAEVYVTAGRYVVVRELAPGAEV